MNGKNLSIWGVVIAVVVILLLVLYYYELIPGVSRMPTAEEISQIADDDEDSVVDEIMGDAGEDIEQEIPEVE